MAGFAPRSHRDVTYSGDTVVVRCFDLSVYLYHRARQRDSKLSVRLTVASLARPGLYDITFQDPEREVPGLVDAFYNSDDCGILDAQRRLKQWVKAAPQ